MENYNRVITFKTSLKISHIEFIRSSKMNEQIEEKQWVKAQTVQRCKARRKPLQARIWKFVSNQMLKLK